MTTGERLVSLSSLRIATAAEHLAHILGRIDYDVELEEREEIMAEEIETDVIIEEPIIIDSNIEGITSVIIESEIEVNLE